MSGSRESETVMYQGHQLILSDQLAAIRHDPNPLNRKHNPLDNSIMRLVQKRRFDGIKRRAMANG